MVILFILVGISVGMAAAIIALLSGGTVLFAILCYSAFGSLGALLVSIIVYMRSDAECAPSEWVETPDAKQPVSA